MLDDGFTLVQGRRRSARIGQIFRKPGSHPVQGSSDQEIDKEELLRKIQEAKNNLLGTNFFTGIKQNLKKALNLTGSESFPEIISFGLGNFCNDLAARYQLALLLLIKELYSSKVYAHDPIFYKSEIDILQNFDIFLISENEEGKRLIRQGITTLLYFPHCAKQLTNNFLWKNWGLGLQNCIIFGNSFSSTLKTSIFVEAKDGIKYLEKIQPFTVEIHVENNFKNTRVFNDTSIHVFPEDKLSVAENSFWTEDCEEPVILSSDLEFIRKIENVIETSHEDSSPIGVGSEKS